MTNRAYLCYGMGMKRRKGRTPAKLPSQLETLQSVRKPLPRPSLVLIDRKRRAKRRRTKRVDPSGE